MYVASATLNNSTQHYDLLLTKYTSNGLALWAEKFNINAGGNFIVGDITLDPSNSIIFTGTVFNGNNNYDAVTVKFNSDGQFNWYKLHNGTANHYDSGVSVTTDLIGNIYITGMSTQAHSPGSQTNSLIDFLTIKYNSSGVQQWLSTHDAYGLIDGGVKIMFNQPGSSKVIVAGLIQKDIETWGVATIYYDTSTGNQMGYGEVIEANLWIEKINGFVTDEQNNIYIAGTGKTSNSSPDSDFIIIKLDDELNVEWKKNHDGGFGGNDQANAIAVKSSGTIFVTGYTTSSTEKDYLTVCYKPDGTLMWSKTYNGIANKDDEARDIFADNTGTIFVTGSSRIHTTKDYLSIQYDDNGNQLWAAKYRSLHQHTCPSSNI